MPSHSVRFDEETEEALEHVCKASGTSVSVVLKRGVLALRDGLASAKTTKPFDIYRALDLGPGGYAQAPAPHAKRAVAEIIRRKHGR
ncbi:MAG TPA: hypothetical protein VFH73_28980 [Polyangia bacterium]|jgi:hypothetical protein|nr:hypothetical protein [Polyangia bacterium]